MISSVEEFGLLLRKWLSASTEVGLLMRTEASSAMPLSTAIIFNIRGTISEIDEAESFFVFSVGERGLVSIGYEGALINYGTSFENDTGRELETAVAGHSLDEVVTLAKPDGLTMCLYTLKPD